MKRTTNILLTISRDDNNIIKVDTKILKEADISVTTKNRYQRYEGPVLQYDFRGVFVREWADIAQAAKEGGFRHGSITDILRGKIKSHRGYIFKLKNQA